MLHFDHLTQLNNAGAVKLKRLEAVAQFLDRTVPILKADNATAQQVQGQLLKISRQPADSVRPQLAALSLRCVISHYIHQTCDRLGQQFGPNYQFESLDLYRFVLDDAGHQSSADPVTGYQPLSVNILQSFDEKRGSLKAWTEQLVKQHPDVKAFLSDCGLYLISDWALLNQATPAKINRIYQDLTPRSTAEIQSACDILQAYHQVYRAALIQSRQQGRTGLCPRPTESQLQDMIALVKGSTQPLTPQTLYATLHELATHLRDYSVTQRRGVRPTRSLDDLSLGVQLVPTNHESSPYQTWLQTYRAELSRGLQRSIQTVVRDRLNYYSETKGRQFLKALHLFHCQGLSMTHIAEQLGLKAQFQVSRLLKLKTLREDIRIRLLQSLLPRLKESAYELASPQDLDQFDHRLHMALAEQIDDLMSQAKAETKTAKDRWQGTMFARILCDTLKDQKFMTLATQNKGIHHVL